MSAEEVVLLDASGRAVGTAPKGQVHHATTPLHLAFSAYLFSDQGQLLVTQRALGKATFPGVWTNSVCGHPGPGEALTEAVRRRAASELGLRVHRLRLVLPGFGYRAEMDGVVENELCPVFVGWLRRDAALRPDPREVEAVEWVGWGAFAAGVLDGGRTVSRWCRQQVSELVRLGDEPSAWPEGDRTHLPPAARASQP